MLHAVYLNKPRGLLNADGLNTSVVAGFIINSLLEDVSTEGAWQIITLSQDQPIKVLNSKVPDNCEETVNFLSNADSDYY